MIPVRSLTSQRQTFTLSTTCRGAVLWGMLAILLAVMVLFGAAAFLLRGPVEQKAKFTGNIKRLLPAARDLEGWRIEDAPIADTPEMRRRVVELLNYDDAVYRIYSLGRMRISVYLAYWRPGRMPVRAIANHTPDVCWVDSGWVCAQRDELETLSVNDIRVAHTEHRIYTINGRIEHVVFWHVAGTEIISYRTGGRPPWYAAITEFFRWGLELRQEQFFLRISSDRPLEEILGTDVFKRVIGKVPGITLTSQ